MTAVVKKVAGPPPSRTWAGLVAPGLGHLLVGDAIPGLGMLAVLGCLAWAATAFPRLPEVLFQGASGTPSLHGVVAIASWVGLAAWLWWGAYRRVRPRELTDEERNGNRQVFLRQFRRHRTGMIGWYGVVVLTAFVLLTPLIAPFDPLLTNVGPENAPPDATHLMGTDAAGRDIFSRVLYGGRISMTVGFITVGLAGTIGTVIGAVAAFSGGNVDRALMWLVDLLLSLPRLVLLLAITGMFRITGSEGLYLMVTILGLTGWMGVSRIVRSQVLSLKEQDFIQAARALGFSSTRIVLRHLIPNAFAPVIVYASLAVGATMLVEAGLSFLGLGVPPPTPTWGTIIADGKSELRGAWWISFFPGLCIIYAVMSFNLLGDGLRDALDPKLRGR
jgi:peptide/nickel transport system permease protein